jgi:hypothetical protein
MRQQATRTGLDMLIHDGLTRLIMKSDGVSPECLQRLLRHVRDARRASAADEPVARTIVSRSQGSEPCQTKSCACHAQAR